MFEQDTTQPSHGTTRREGVATGVAMIFGGLAASCCVLPIALTIIGLGGSWLSFLGPFVRFRIPILIVVGLVLAWSWYRLLRSASARRGRYLLNGLATLVFLGALTSPLWEADVSAALWDIYTETER